MVQHSCPRCGFHTGHNGWVDRNPYAAVLLAVPAFMFSIGALVAYPWLLLPLLVITAAAWVDWRRRRGAAIAARADFDYRQQMITLAVQQRSAWN